MTQEPEYIIGGTKVEVGQVYENNHKAHIVIQDIDFEDSDGNDCAIYGSGFIYSATGECESRDSQLIKCVGVVETSPVTPQPDADGWIAWHGGECPVDVGTVIDIKCRDGYTHENVDVYGWDWNHGFGAVDIIAYRVVKPETEVSQNLDAPKKLMLSAGEMVDLLIKCSNWDWSEEGPDAVTVLKQKIEAIEADPELRGRVK